VGQRITPRFGQEFTFQGAVQAFHLALRLGMVRRLVKLT